MKTKQIKASDITSMLYGFKAVDAAIELSDGEHRELVDLLELTTKTLKQTRTRVRAEADRAIASVKIDPFKMKTSVEYWVSLRDAEGDMIDDYLYMGNDKREALRIARSTRVVDGSSIDIERVTSKGNNARGIVDRNYECIDITTGEIVED